MHATPGLLVVGSVRFSLNVSLLESNPHPPHQQIKQSSFVIILLWQAIYTAIAFLAVSGFLPFMFCFCHSVRRCLQNTRISGLLYRLHFILAITWPIVFFGGFTLLGIGFVLM